MKRLLALLVIIGLGPSLMGASGALASATTTTTAVQSVATTTTTSATKSKRVRTAPLTGLADPMGLSRHRPAVTIKIDNTPEARPQYGIDKADVIYEEIVEGGITRLAAIFNSRVAVQVGPVRSVRRTDREIVYPIGGIFVFSGGASYALKSIATAPVRLFQESNAGSAMFRDPRRYPPHNLFANAALLIKQVAKPRPPPALFTYRNGSGPVPGAKVTSFVVGFSAGYAASYAWNVRTRSWDRSIFAQSDVTANVTRLSPKNVIVMKVHYLGGVGVIGSQAQLIGSGPAEVFTGGTVQRATWSRHKLHKPIVYRAASGRLIPLTPGQTWVELLDVSEHVSIVLAK
jgi:hypothetical protein